MMCLLESLTLVDADSLNDVLALVESLTLVDAESLALSDAESDDALVDAESL